MTQMRTALPQLLPLWERLTPEHQILVTHLMQSLAAIDTELADHHPGPNQDTLALLQAWQAEVTSMTPQDAAAADADWADMQAALNANRAPEPPLFP